MGTLPQAAKGSGEPKKNKIKNSALLSEIVYIYIESVI
jgi:hypothetical protein